MGIYLGESTIQIACKTEYKYSHFKFSYIFLWNMGVFLLESPIQLACKTEYKYELFKFSNIFFIEYGFIFSRKCNSTCIQN